MKVVNHIFVRHRLCDKPKQYKFCLECKGDRLHIINRYEKATANLKLYHFTCLNCFHEGEE
ncbi:hypothetical protein LCGC14_2816540 [marine sediment metagenome]|uniref:Uncharacterized protein n=1 Tax=marine sediment metagenome TaxID=412755 RepID=A0A0F9B9K0_9ZZZZ